jgi:hypothetical protein
MFTVVLTVSPAPDPFQLVKNQFQQLVPPETSGAAILQLDQNWIVAWVNPKPLKLEYKLLKYSVCSSQEISSTALFAISNYLFVLRQRSYCNYSDVETYALHQFLYKILSQ